jgi:hypothetical protein
MKLDRRDMIRMAVAAAVTAAVAPPVPALAQMDWLTPHLEIQRQNNIRKHQQGTAGKKAEANAQPQAAPSVTPAQRQAAWSRHRGEYTLRVLRDGQASADRWLDQLVLEGR